MVAQMVWNFNFLKYVLICSCLLVNKYIRIFLIQVPKNYIRLDMSIVLGIW